MLPVRFLPEATAQLEEVERYIATQGDPAVAERYVGRILARCELLSALPYGGRLRKGASPGLRSISFKGRVTIYYRVDEAEITIAGLRYGGQDEARFLAALPR